MAREKTAEEKIRSFENKKTTKEKGGCDNLRDCTDVREIEKALAREEMKNPDKVIANRMRMERFGR